MRIIKKFFHFVAIILTINITSVQANMVLDRMIVHFKPNKQWADIIVANPEKESLFLKVSVIKVENPGTPKEKKITITTPEQIELLVSPQKIEIPANGRQTIRVTRIIPSPKDKELVYRLAFTPVVGKIKTNKNAIKILISYQAIIFIQPSNPFIQIASTPAKQSVKFTNSGNVNVLLHQGKYCPQSKDKDKTKCTDIEGIRIYAGENWTMKLPENTEPTGTITFSLHDGTKEHLQTFSLTKGTITQQFKVI